MDVANTKKVQGTSHSFGVRSLQVCARGFTRKAGRGLWLARPFGTDDCVLKVVGVQRLTLRFGLLGWRALTISNGLAQYHRGVSQARNCRVLGELRHFDAHSRPLEKWGLQNLMSKPYITSKDLVMEPMVSDVSAFCQLNAMKRGPPELP